MAEGPGQIHDVDTLMDYMMKYKHYKRVQTFLKTMQQLKRQNTPALVTSTLRQFLEEITSKNLKEINKKHAAEIKDALYQVLIKTRPDESEFLKKRMEELNEAQKENDKLQGEKDKLLDDIERFQLEVDQKMKIIQHFETTANDAYGENLNLTAELENMKKLYEELGADFGVVHGENEQRKKRIVHLEEHFKAYEGKSNERMKVLVAERDDLRKRFARESTSASQLPKAGQPDWDISDRNRPTRLAEDFKNIYDDEWTDAFEYLTEEKKYKEEQAIDTLYDLIKVCNDLVKTKLQTQYQQLECFVTTPDVFNTSKRTTVERSAASHLEPLFMQFRRDIATDVLQNVSELALVTAVDQQTNLPEDVLLHFFMRVYLMKCFKTCWYMGVQFPPMEIDFTHKVGEPFKSELFKVYNKSGAKFSRIVWPPVFLHHKGPSAGIGYADGEDKK